MPRYQDEVKYEIRHVTVMKMTARAVLMRNQVSKVEFWVPQSCLSVETLNEIGEGFIGDVEIAEWLCKKEGI